MKITDYSFDADFTNAQWFHASIFLGEMRRLGLVLSCITGAIVGFSTPHQSVMDQYAFVVGYTVLLGLLYDILTYFVACMIHQHLRQNGEVISMRGIVVAQKDQSAMLCIEDKTMGYPRLEAVPQTQFCSECHAQTYNLYFINPNRSRRLFRANYCLGSHTSVAKVA